jgi:hypothetical protein
LYSSQNVSRIIAEAEMGGASGINRKAQKCIKILSENLKRRNHLGHLGLA